MALLPPFAAPSSPDPTRRRVAVVSDENPTGLYGYVRQLDDDQLVVMGENVALRIQALLAQGIPIPMAQIENHHLLGLLESLAGAELANNVREWHLLWTDGQLDAIEAEMRLRLLDSGLFDGAGP